MHQIFCDQDAKNKKSLNPILYFIATFPKLLWDFIKELINLKYAFNTPFKIIQIQSLHRLILSQFNKAFGLSATLVAY